jgi:hypothetical protein
MKKLLLSVLAIGAIGVTYGQKTVGTAVPVKRMVNASQEKIPTDTIVPDGYANATSLIIYSGVDSAGNNLGYIYGTNSFGDRAKAQRFLLNAPVLVEEVLLRISNKFDSGNNGFITVGLYTLDGPGDNSLGPVSDAPNTLYSSVDVMMADVDTAGLTIAQLPMPTWVGEDVCAGFNMDGLATDTAGLFIDSIGMVSSDNGFQSGFGWAWEQWAGGSWNTIERGWPGLENDAGIFLVIDESTASINEEATVNGMKLSFMTGNIVVDNTVQLGYSTDADARMALEVMDVKGAVVYNENLGNRAAGDYYHNVDVSAFRAGTYYVSVVSNGNRLTKKMIVK